jgi:hypothetical protein
LIGSAASTSYDVNTASIPRGGIIISVASTEGFGYQPLVSAGGTAIVSGLGTISSISIGNSGFRLLGLEYKQLLMLGWQHLSQGHQISNLLELRR